MFSSLPGADVMYLHKLGLVIIVLLFSSFVIAESAADEIESKVNADIDIDLETATDFNILVTMDVNEITVFSSTYDSESIQTIATSDLETLGAIKLRLRQLIEEQIESSFEGADITALVEKPTYKNTIFSDGFSVDLTNSFFNINDTINIHDFVNGVLDMNAVVSYTFDFQAEEGWNNTYAMTLPASMIPRYANVEIHGGRMEWDVKNGQGSHPTTAAELRLKLVDPTTSGLNSEDIQLDFVLDTEDTRQIGLSSNILVRNIDIRNYGILPDFITELEFVPSDGIRLFENNGMTSWEIFHQNAIKSVEDAIISTIENSTFNQTLDMVFSWDNETTTDCEPLYNITHMDADPAIKAILTDDDVDLKICNESARAIFGLVHAGAEINISSNDVNFGGGFGNIGYPYTGTLYLPDKLRLDGKNTYIWNQSSSISGEFQSEVSPRYSEEDLDAVIEIEMKSADLNLLSLFTGKTELSMGLFLQEGRNYSITTLPNEFVLPDKLYIDYLNADAFRLCVQEQVFSEEDVNTFLTDNVNVFTNRMTSIFSQTAFDVDGHTNQDIFDESVEKDVNITSMTSINPVKVNSYAHSSYPISFGLSFIPPGFEIEEQNFTFQGLQNQDVIYRITFPHDTTVSVEDSLGRVSVATAEDGRKYIEVAFNASESSLEDYVNCKIVPSLIFVLGFFMPCIVSFIIVIILVAVVVILRRKRKGKKIMVVEKDSNIEGYEDQDYYVPPPPPSSRQ